MSSETGVCGLISQEQGLPVLAEVEVGSSENEKQDVGTVITERPSSLLRARASMYNSLQVVL